MTSSQPESSPAEPEEVVLHGHEDLFTFFGLNKARKRTMTVPKTFDHYVDHLHGLSNLTVSTTTPEEERTAQQKHLVRVDAKTGGEEGTCSGIPAKHTLLLPFLHNEPPPTIDIQPLSEGKFERSIAFQSGRPLGQLDMSQPVRRKKEKKSKKKKRKHRDPGSEEKAHKKRRRDGAIPAANVHANDLIDVM